MNIVAPGKAWSVGIGGERATFEIRFKESNGFKTHPVRAVTRPEASLASVGKSESGSVDSGY